jgi:hypothetical protein
MAAESIFATCSKTYDAQTNITGLLQCLSETQESVGQNCEGILCFYIGMCIL